MTYPTTHLELTREQKLLGEIIVQLGNISEAINVLATSDVELIRLQKITDLEASITASFNATILFCRKLIAFKHNTPPTLYNDVVSNLGIELPQ